VIWIDSDQVDISQSGRAAHFPRTVTGAEEIVAPALAPPTRRRWKWLRRFAWVTLLLLILVGMLAVTVQLVLWSDVPRRIVVAELEKQLGLRVEAEKLSTNWWGQTQLRNVSLSLPLGKEAFVRVPRMEVRHTWLVPLLLRRPLNVKSLTLEEPTLVVQQDRAGHWDILEVLDLLQRTGGKEQAQAATGSGAAQAAVPATMVLPEIHLRNGSLRLMPWNGQPVDIRGIAVEGKPSGRLVWLYEAQAGDPAGGENGRGPFASVKGEVAPGGDWPHVLKAEVRNMRPWVQSLAPWWPERAAADVTWDGRLQGDTVTGLLEVGSLHAMDFEAHGSMDVTATTGRAALQPRTLTLTTPYAAVARVQMRGGSIAAAADGVEVENLDVGTMGGRVAVGGRFNWARGDGQARLAWADLQPLPGWTLAGDAGLTLSGMTHGELAVNATRRVGIDLRTRAQTPAGQLETTAEVRANGSAWNSLDWEADIGRAAWSGSTPVEVTGVAARGRVTPAAVTLASLTAKGPGSISGSGEYHYADGTWTATVRAQDLPIPQTPDTAQIALDARGDREAVKLQQAILRAAGVTAEATGTYVYALPKPLDLEVQLQETTFNPPRAVARNGSGPPTTTAADAPADRSVRLQGKVRGTGRLRGTISPLALDIQGRLMAQDLALRTRHLGDAEVEVSGGLTDQALQLATTEMDVLGGTWNWSANYPFATRRATVRVRVDHLPLADVAEALQLHVDVDGPASTTQPATANASSPAGVPMLRGVATGTLTIETPGLDLAQARGDGMVRIDGPQVQLRTSAVPPLAAQSAQAHIMIADGRLEISPEARQGDLPKSGVDGGEGVLRGRLTADLREPERITAQLRLDDWILRYGKKEGRMRLSGDVQGTVDVRTVSGNAEARTRTELWYEGQRIGQIGAAATLAGRVVNVSQLGADLLGGKLEGSARVNLDNLVASNATLQWQDLDAERLALFQPLLDGAAGTYSGSITVAPDRDPRALEPLKATAVLTSRGGNYRGIPIGDGRAEVYASPTRLVLNRSVLDIAGGRVTLWGRTIQRNGQWTTNQFRIAAEKLDLNTIVQSLRPGSEEMIGLVSGEMDTLGDPRRPHALSGGGTLRIEQSDLVNSDIVAALYSALNIGATGRQTAGHGRMTFRFEQGDAHINELYYFNRGVQIRGTGVVKDVLNLPNSPIDLTAAGTARPLRDVKLPLLTDLDEIIGVLQSHVTTVRATGTLADPQVVPLLLEEAGQDLKEILLGEVRRR
jgi:hypothetical protein